MNQELELYKLIMIPDEDDSDILYVDEFGWINDEKFYVWVKLIWFEDFIVRLREIFGCGIYDDYGITAKIQDDYICIDLEDVLGDYINLENVFPKDKYQH